MGERKKIRKKDFEETKLSRLYRVQLESQRDSCLDSQESNLNPKGIQEKTKLHGLL